MLIKTYTGGHGYDVHDVTVSHDNSKFASCGGDKSVVLWDVSSGRVLRKMTGHDNRVNAVAFNGDSSVLISGSYDGTVRCWDCRSRSHLPIQVLKHCRDSVTSLAVYGPAIVVGSVDGCVRTYDLRGGAVYTDDLGDPVVCVSVSGDGLCILASCLSATAGGGKCRLLEAKSGTLLNDYKGHENTSFHIDSCFAQHDAHIASGSESGEVVFWDLLSTEVVGRLTGHAAAVCSVACHPTKNMVLSASHDSTVRVWT